MKPIRFTTMIMIAAVTAAVLSAGCSVVFTGSITGSIVDREDYDNGNDSSGIPDAEIFLYTDLDDRNSDYDAWAADSSRLPDNPAEGEPVYFLKTITDGQGDYTFNGFIWNELFPDYGKSGDRKEIYMLFYHKEYGLVKTPYPVYVVSDVTNRIPLFKLDKILNTAEIAGSVSASDGGEPLANVNIRVWVPESWSYDSTGAVSEAVWPENPSYLTLTDVSGQWSQEISYAMQPSVTENEGTTIVRITYTANGYIAENSADPEITDGGWDRDGNGTVDEDEESGYMESELITAESYTDLGDIALADEYNNAIVSGTVLNSSTNEGEPNVSVRIYVAEDWTYNSADPDDIEPAAGVDWPENPQYTVATDADGVYTASIRYDRKPSDTDNYGTTRVRLVFVKSTYTTDSTVAGMTAGGWDRDGSGTIDADEDDTYYDPAGVVTSDTDNDLGSIKIKQTEFSETLSGEVWSSAATPALTNGVEVWLFYAPDETTHETALPVAGDYPTRTASTASVTNVVTATTERGHFSFTGLEWTDDSYTGDQSKVSYYIYLPTVMEQMYGYLDGTDLTNNMHYLYSGGSNYISLSQ